MSSLHVQYTQRAWFISINFPPFRFSDKRIVGYYDSESLADRVQKTFFHYFMPRIQGGADVFYEPCYVQVIQIGQEWVLKHLPQEKIRTSYDEVQIQAQLAAFTEYAKKLQIRVIEGSQERTEGIFKEPGSSKRKAEEEPTSKQKKLKIDHTEDSKISEQILLDLGFQTPLDTLSQLRKAYKEWVRINHPDKKPSGDERNVAQSVFQKMQAHYETLLKVKAAEVSQQAD